MQTGSVSQAPLSPEQSKQQTATSVDSQIEKLEKRKEKLEADMHKNSSNPDPKAAQGENAANKIFNSKEIQRLEAQLTTLRSRQASEAEAKEKPAEDRPKAAQVGSTSGGFVDRFV